MPPEPASRVVVTADGPVLVEGPVDITLPDGRTVRSERPLTALCVCGNSRRYPVCDTSHRRRVRSAPQPPTAEPPTADPPVKEQP